MHWPNLRGWIWRERAQSAPAGPRPLARLIDSAPEPDIPKPPALWHPERLALTDALWGDGFQFPGGELETLRLARPLGLSAAASLLLLGCGSGGPACSIAAQLGVWVTGFEADPELAAAAGERSIRSGLGRRAQVEPWDPLAPELGRGYFHHGLAFEPLRDASPEPVLSAVAAALKPGGQLTLVETIADKPLDPLDSAVAAWARVDARDPALLQSQAAITRMLGRLGFEVRIVEDISARYAQQAMLGWRRVVHGLENARPSPRQAGVLVAEAELWLLRLRLFQASLLRRVRWHAIGRGG
jgi:cyclopropane fatty-acyl-phospholipid synthase-like methyltransferase